VNNEQLTSLGETLRRDLQALLTKYTTCWLHEEPLGQADIQPLHALQADLANLAHVVYDFAGLQAWLTSGFVPADLALSNNPVASMPGEAATVEADQFAFEKHNAPRGDVTNENRVGQDSTPAHTHPPPPTAHSPAIGEGWEAKTSSEKQSIQKNLRASDATTVERSESRPLAVDVFPPQPLNEAPPSVQGLEAFARRLESEPDAPAEASESAGRVAVTPHTRSPRDHGLAASVSRPIRPPEAVSGHSGVQDLEVVGLSQTSDHRSIFPSGAVEMPPAMNPTGLTTEPASRPASGAVPTTRSTPPSSSTAPWVIVEKFARVQAGVTPDKPLKRGLAIEWPDEDTAARNYVSPAEPPAGQFDMAEVLEALARSVEQEYKRFYGT
jgi:hypothetical protein